jgi:hypothetical protein
MFEIESENRPVRARNILGLVKMPFHKMRAGTTDSFFVSIPVASEIKPVMNLIRNRAARENVRVIMKTGYKNGYRGSKENVFGVRVWRDYDIS